MGGGTGGDPTPSGDDDGNLTLTAPDLLIDASERAAVAFTVSGLDADATAVVTVSDGTASVSGSLAADGTLLLDLSGLADGPLTSAVTATDTGGATATVAGPGLTLLVPSGDDDGNLTLTAPDLLIDASERAAVAFTVSGLDADATAVVTVSDGTASVSGSLAADGTLLLDLSGLADGPLTSAVTATDTGGATATVAGPGLMLLVPSGDDDGNLALTAPDLVIDASERAAVDLHRLGARRRRHRGGDGERRHGERQRVAAANGTLVLDLTGLAYGALTSAVTATDGGGATATVAGPGLTLLAPSGDDDGNLALAAPDLLSTARSGGGDLYRLGSRRRRHRGGHRQRRQRRASAGRSRPTATWCSTSPAWPTGR